MIKYLYKITTQFVLYAILVGVLYYVTLFAYLTVSTNWSIPFILTPENEKVIAFQRDYIDRQYRLHEAKKLYIQNQMEYETLKANGSLASNKISQLDSLDYKSAISALDRLSKSAATLFDQLVKVSKPENEIRVGIIDRSKYLSELVSRFDLDIKSVTVSISRYQAIETSLKIEEDVNKSRILLKYMDIELDRLDKAIHNINEIVTSLENSLNYMRNSPYSKAVTQNVAVIFIPYTNLRDFEATDQVKSCEFFLFWCKNVAKIKTIHESEQVVPHPMLNKPLRGTIALLEMENIKNAKQNIFFAGTPFGGITSILKRFKN